MMKQSRLLVAALWAAASLFASADAFAGSANIAVAANFTEPAKEIAALFKAKTGYDMDDTSGRNMQAMFVLADAINRAGSAKSDAIQAALQKTDLKPEQLMMGYKGVKFDETGQNTLAATYLIQLQGANYVAVWPEKSATAKMQIPFKGSE